MPAARAVALDAHPLRLVGVFVGHDDQPIRTAMPSGFQAFLPHTAAT